MKSRQFNTFLPFGLCHRMADCSHVCLSMCVCVCDCTSMLFRQLKKLKDYIKCAICIIFCHSENIQYTLCLDDVDDGGASGVIIIVVTRVLNSLVPFSISASNNQLLSNKHSQCFDVPHFQLISRTRTNI